MLIYLRRADNIVRDAEAVRMSMVPPDAPGGGRWTLLGQSFGGFCAVIFLSHSLLAVVVVHLLMRLERPLQFDTMLRTTSS